MEIQLTAADRRFGDAFYRRYRAKPGSAHIASPSALMYLSACLRLYRPRVVVESGAGIGTMTDALLSHECGVERVIATEHDSFCLQALKQNLLHHDAARLTIVRNAKDKAFQQVAADMFVLDGGKTQLHAHHVTRPDTIVFFEGGRPKARAEFNATLAGHGLSVDLREYGAGKLPRWLEYLRTRLPVSMRPKRAKGAWIGVVEIDTGSREAGRVTRREAAAVNAGCRLYDPCGGPIRQRVAPVKRLRQRHQPPGLRQITRSRGITSPVDRIR